MFSGNVSFNEDYSFALYINKSRRSVGKYLTSITLTIFPSKRQMKDRNIYNFNKLIAIIYNSWMANDNYVLYIKTCFNLSIKCLYQLRN